MKPTKTDVNYVQNRQKSETEVSKTHLLNKYGTLKGYDKKNANLLLNRHSSCAVSESS